MLRRFSIRGVGRDLETLPTRRPYHTYVPSGWRSSVSRPYQHAVLLFTLLGSASGLVLGKSVFQSRISLAESGDDERAWSSKPTFIGRSSSFDQPEARDKTRGARYRPGQQPPPPQTKGHSELSISSIIEETKHEAQTPGDWLSSVYKQLTNFDFSEVGDKMTDAILPAWAKLLPGYIRKLQDEMSMSSGSLADEIWQEANDPECNPEITWDANVRVSNNLCREEAMFLRKRKMHTRKALAQYLDVPEADIHPDDVPVIAMCGSGGGLRALVAGTSSYLCAQQAGLYDCITYTAGVSGSCWLQSLFYSSVGRQDYAHIIDHLKHRLGVHIAFPPAALGLLSSAPTNKYLLSGVVEKLKGVPNADFGIVDIYGLLLAARLMVPRGDLGIDYRDLKVSDQQHLVNSGTLPLPIYTAVRHEIPKEEIQKKTTEELHEKAKKEAWFQWFEWTPFEFFCEELGAGIPSWAIGREFDGGVSVWRENGLALPELRIPILMGVWGSAFCATLSHYYKEVQPLVKGLAGFAGIDQIIAERDDDLIKVHPIEPATIPNFATNMKNLLPQSCPKGIHESKHLQLMDAGMSNNLPIYPLLRPGRNVDVIITFDASADVKKDNWLKVADGYVRQRGIIGWPVGAGWPTEDESAQEVVKDLDTSQAVSAEDAAEHLKQAQVDADVIQKGSHGVSAQELGYCTVWVGSREERQHDPELPGCKRVEEDWQLMRPDAGITVIYFPFIPNPKADGVDPQRSDFMSTWNFVYTPEEIDKVVGLARANFEAGEEQTKRTVRAVWQRKRKQRLERERSERDSRWTLNLAKINR